MISWFLLFNLHVRNKQRVLREKNKNVSTLIQTYGTYEQYRHRNTGEKTSQAEQGPYLNDNLYVVVDRWNNF